MNQELLDKYVEEKWLVKQIHPYLPLAIYNYSRSTQYESHWDEVTLACRGLIVDTSTGQVIVKPFPKFFNYEEVSSEVPWETSACILVQEKMDGSLGILFRYQNEWVLATRGSFTSDQAIRGMEIIEKNFHLPAFDPSIAYMVEIIYPENRIVVDYGEEKIVFLGASPNFSFGGWNEGEEELSWAETFTTLAFSGIDEKSIVKTEQFVNNPNGDQFSHRMYVSLKEKNLENREGYVLRFLPSNFRCKIKFENYTALHRIVTQVSSYDIWENLKKNGCLPDVFLDNVPDEFDSWVRKTSAEITDHFNFIKSLHTAHVNSVKSAGITDRKLLAQIFLNIKDNRVNSGVLFQIHDGKSADDKIWDMVKPTYSKPFAFQEP